MTWPVHRLLNAAYELSVRHADGDQRAEFDAALASAGQPVDAQSRREAAVLAAGGMLG